MEFAIFVQNSIEIVEYILTFDIFLQTLQYSKAQKKYKIYNSSNNQYVILVFEKLTKFQLFERTQGLRKNRRQFFFSQFFRSQFFRSQFFL